MLLDTPDATGARPLARRDLLRWLYLGRLTLVTGILAGALLTWFAADDQATLVATVVFLVALVVTSASFWWTHILARDPGQNFLYAQVILDTLIVTSIVHITGGPESDFAPLYILVISAGALLLPLPGGVLVGGLASMVYFGDLVWGFGTPLEPAIGFQIGLFTLVALATGILGDRLRRAGMALGAVESELRQLRLDTGDILANLATGVLTVDGDGRLMYANPAAETLLGLTPDGWMGRPVMQEVERVAPGMGALLARSIEDGNPVERYQTVARRDGREIHLGISTAVLERGDGVPPSATAIFQDITDLQRLEVLNRRAARLEAVAELSASRAHEIRNPLASIRSAVEQITRSSLTDEDRGTLERLVLTESDRLSRLLSEFLDYSGLRLGPRSGVDVSAVVRDCVTLVRQHPDAHDVTVVCQGIDEPVLLAADRDLLHRALFNLLLNGVQYAGDGGRVVVSVSDERHTARPRGTPIEHPVRITVADSGPGVSDDVTTRIFDPFFTTREGGSGLGLAVVYRAVEAHDGAIFVDRGRNGGAEFVIYLPGHTGREGDPSP
ncbi:MAG: ATP-binding protein [Longimicrobiales bacterium]